MSTAASFTLSETVGSHVNLRDVITWCDALVTMLLADGGHECKEEVFCHTTHAQPMAGCCATATFGVCWQNKHHMNTPLAHHAYEQGRQPGGNALAVLPSCSVPTGATDDSDALTAP